MTRKKAVVVVAVAALVIAIYAVAGFVLAPRLVRSALLKDLPAAIRAKPSVGSIKINPFLLQLTINDFALTDAAGETLVAFRRLFVDLQVSSIWHRAYTFANIDLTAPFVSAVLAKDGKLNLLQLAPVGAKPKAAEASEENQPLPALRVHSLKVLDGGLAFEDRTQPDAFAARIEPINFELKEFTTGVAGGKFTFTGVSKLGERLEWHGHISVDPLESDGEFQVTDLKVRTLWDFMQDRVNFLVDSGRIDLQGTYRAALADPSKETYNLDVALARFAVSDFKLRPRESVQSSGAPWIEVGSLEANGGKVSLSQRTAHIDNVTVKGLALETWLEPDGTINLAKLVAAGGPETARANTPVQPSTTAPPSKTTPPSATAPPSTTAPPSATAPPSGTASASSRAPGSPATQASAATPAWTFDLRSLDVLDARVEAEDRSVQPALKTRLAPLSLKIDGLSQDLGKPVKASLDTRIDGKGSLRMDGEITPVPIAAEMTVKLADLELSMFQPYISRQTAMTLREGVLAADARVLLAPSSPGLKLQFMGNASVDGLHTVDDALHDDFLNWGRVDIQGINYTQHPDRLDVDRITALKLYSRFIIEPDATLNVKRVLKIPAVPVAVAAGQASAKAQAAVAEAGAKATAIAKVAVGAVPAKTAIDAMAAPTSKHSDSQRTAAAVAQAVGAQSAAPSLPMSIKRIDIQDSQLNFADLSVTPNFSAGIGDLKGSITGMSSKPGSRAAVDLKGALDKFSPVSISGQLNILGPLYTDLAMRFSNISLAVFNPYSGKFAGYNIVKGKLDTELHYKVNGRALDAQHHIVVQELEFGNKTASKDAVSLPIKLAVALLKDRNGVIDLNLPVSGSLDDPQFKLGGVIWKVFVNILEKAVTAPFELLGSLFGKGPDIQYIEFDPGSSALDANALDKLKTIEQALAERPQLKIDVPIAVVPDIDRQALIDTLYAAKVSSVQPASPKSGPASGQDLSAQLATLSRLYEKDHGHAPSYPDEVARIKSKAEQTSAKLDYLRKAIREHIAVSEDDLQTLGQQRAQALQTALLTDQQVSAERVFLVANDKASEKDDKVRLELTLE